MPLAVSIFEGPDLVYSFVNKAHGKYFTGRDLVGKTILEAIPEASQQDLIPLLQRVYKTGEPFSAQEKVFYFKQADGSERKFFLNFNFEPLRYPNGEIFGVISTSEDVTEKVELNEKFKFVSQRNTKNEALLNQAVSLAKIGFYEWNMVTDELTLSSEFKSDWGLSDGCSFSMAIDQIVEDDRERVKTLINAAVKNRTPYRAEYRIKRKEGAIRWVEVQGSVDYASDGTATRFFGISLDITSRKEFELKLARERFQLDQIFQKSPAAMTTWLGEDLIFDRVNPDYQNIFPGRELAGRPLLEACPELKGQGFDDLLRNVMKTKKPYYGHEVLVKIAPALGADVRDHYYNFAYIPLLDAFGNAYGVYDHAIDVTDAVLARREADAARIAANDANVTKSQFLANMSHEIRSPLGAIMGFSDLLRSGDLSMSDTQKYATIIDRNSKHLLRIVDDILDLSKVEAGMMTIEKIEFSLVEVLADFSSLMGFKAREKGINFDLKFATQVPEKVISDPTRLRQILNNMVSNAIKFTDRGRVQLTVSCIENDLVLSVSDTGIGIAEEQTNNLFSPFQQADSTTARKFGGTGLGLVLTRRICEAMNGEFVLEKTKPGVGSTFKAVIGIQLPKQVQMLTDSKVSRSTKEGSVEEVSNLLSDAKILLIEDSPDNQFLISFVLSKQGARVEIANNGLEGVDMALTNSYDVVLCDIQMPIKDGYDTVRELRLQGYSVPIVALTAHAMKEEQSRALKSGFSDYLTKPIEKSELFATILRLL